MKRLVLFLLLLSAGVYLFAQVQLPEHYFASGSWRLSGDRLYQNDATARLAKTNLRIPQNGPMIYEFNVRYEGGDWGGFGIHIFAEDIYHRASWGSGDSYLLWLNYDENPVTRGIPRGLSAQIYRSRSSSQMDLVESISLKEYEDILLDSLSEEIPFTIWADGNTGEVRVYDPADSGQYYYFYMDKKDLPMKGNWVSLRTNGLKLSFGM
ncbi:MAG: hypothetical protein LBB81_05250 [Treponema sp.]|jgi:hypothetical protein|nr:hypothetical protein [Treponema sp.]